MALSRASSKAPTTSNGATPKGKREPVGTDAAEAGARKRQKEAELRARRHGVAIVSPENGNGHRRPIAIAMQKWLGDIQRRDRITKPHPKGQMVQGFC